MGKATEFRIKEKTTRLEAASSMDLAQQRTALEFKLSTLLNYEEAAGLRIITQDSGKRKLPKDHHTAPVRG
jgi:hypothetical protein